MRNNIIQFLLIWFLSTCLVSSQDAAGDSFTACTSRQSQSDCQSCITAHPECIWCSIMSNLTVKRCTTRANSDLTQQCATELIQNPQSDDTATGNVEFTRSEDINFQDQTQTIIQLKPQTFDIKLRKGQPRKINVTFRRVYDYPLDLYFVMDLSYSMGDDLKLLQNLGGELVDEIRNITDNVRLGFGTFVDKVIMPFASTVPDQLVNPCANTDNTVCAPVFGFRHQLPITADGKAFIDAVKNTTISGNIDSPEGGFDALMQIAVCQQKIQWRNESLRVILFTSDASPHLALDGKLAAILEKNDMKCYLDSGVHPYLQGATVYTKSKVMDYPSIGQLQEAFTVNKIQPIFAVTAEVVELYKDLPKLIKTANVETLASDSGNIVKVIEKAYNALKSKISLDSPAGLPSNVQVQYRVLCDGKTWTPNSLACESVGIGDEVVYEFEFTATSCPTQTNQRDVARITSSSITDSVTLNIEYLCDCDCAQNRVSNSSLCSFKGDFECGVCRCENNVKGRYCHCEASEQDVSDESCRPSSGPTTELCSGRGTCTCGICECDNDVYNGKYCECSTTGCPSDETRGICGGRDRGSCKNCNGVANCECIDGWKQNQDGVCACRDTECREFTNSTVCYGRGDCPCEACRCKPEYIGKYCETCSHPDCINIDATCTGEDIRRCAQCIYDQQNAGSPEIDAKCKEEFCLNGSLVYVRQSEQQPELPGDCNECVSGVRRTNCELCRQFNLEIFTPVQCFSSFTASGCVVAYQIAWVRAINNFTLYVRPFNQARDCPPPLNPLLIVLPVIGGIVLIGLIALILWKIFQTLRDKKEYESFVEDTKKSQWSKGENPLFSKPAVRIENPAFVGN